MAENIELGFVHAHERQVRFFLLCEICAPRGGAVPKVESFPASTAYGPGDTVLRKCAACGTETGHVILRQTK